MVADSDLLPLPDEFCIYRDQLRVVGYELVRYSTSYARTAASRYGLLQDHEYAIHKIESISPESGQVLINVHPFYTSAKRIPDWTKHYVSHNAPLGFGLLKQWVSSWPSALMTLAAPPAALFILVGVALGDRQERKKQSEVAQRLHSLSEMPKFLKDRPPRA